MEISKASYSPNFQAKLIIGNDKIHKYIKSSFMAKSRETFDTLDKISEIHPDTIVSINIKNLKNRDYMVAKNGVTGATEAKLLHDSEVLKLEDRTSFIDLIKKIMNKKTFWDKPLQETVYFDATAKKVNVEHDVFKLDK